MASIISPSSIQFISTPKFSSTQSRPNSVSFRQSQRISASYSTTAEHPTTFSATVSHSSSMYEILGIDMVASFQEIKAAYRRLALVSHPDVASKNDSSVDEFIKIHAAYSTLSDPRKRANYDQSLFKRERRMNSMTVRASTSSSRYSGYTTGWSWETDQCW